LMAWYCCMTGVCGVLLIMYFASAAPL